MGEDENTGKLPKLLTAEQVADELSIGVAAVYRMVRAGTIPTVRIGTLIRFLPEQLEEWLAKGGTKRTRRSKKRKVDVLDETATKRKSPH